MNFSNIKIAKVNSIFEIQRIKEDVKKTSIRNNSGIVVIRNGKISYYQDDTEVVQTADTAIILPKGITYSLYCHEDASCYLINFDEETELLGDKIHAIKITHKKNIIDKVDKMCKIWSMRSNSYNLMLMSLMYGILADLNDTLAMNKQQRKYYETIKPSIDFMEEHCYDLDIKNDDLARISNISTVYFRKIFTKLYGVSPIHYLEIRKIEKAKELLNSEELSVTEIAATSGFKDVYHFSRAFKRITGFSPNNYRKEFLL
ncbi:MAG: helix-turn-helix transcriptional regulator [Clostridia bacterium]|nr:helix-turn-helix transcriptional regulator [Clostridia bacterium]